VGILETTNPTITSTQKLDESSKLTGKIDAGTVSEKPEVRPRVSTQLNEQLRQEAARMNLAYRKSQMVSQFLLSSFFQKVII